MSAPVPAAGLAEPSADLLAAINSGLVLLEEERQVFLSGAYHRIVGLVERKTALLAFLEQAIRAAPRTADIVAAVSRLIAESRRNEGIIRAARDGVARARRRLRAIRQTARGAVAYAGDGSPITCVADSIDTEKSA